MFPCLFSQKRKGKSAYKRQIRKWCVRLEKSCLRPCFCSFLWKKLYNLLLKFTQIVKMITACLAQAVIIFIPGEITTGGKGSNPRSKFFFFLFCFFFFFWWKKILYRVPVYFCRKGNANQHIKGTLNIGKWCVSLEKSCLNASASVRFYMYGKNFIILWKFL